MQSNRFDDLTQNHFRLRMTHYIATSISQAALLCGLLLKQELFSIDELDVAAQGNQKAIGQRQDAVRDPNIELEDKQIQSDPDGGWIEDTEQFNAAIAAKVNGQVIHKGELLGRFAQYLESVRKAKQENAGLQLAQLRKQWERKRYEEYCAIRERLVQSEIGTVVYQTMFVQYFYANASTEQIVEANSKIESRLQKDLEETRSKFHLKTSDEIENKLKQMGTSSRHLRESLERTIMPGECLRVFCTPEMIPEAEAREYYELNLKEFFVPGTVDWVKLQVNYPPDSGPDDFERAKAKLESALQIVKSHTDPKKNQDLVLPKDVLLQTHATMLKGSLTDTELEAALFKAPLNMWSQPNTRLDAVFCTLVIDRTEPKQTSFEGARKRIEDTITNIKRQTRYPQFALEVMSESVVLSKYQLNKVRVSEGPLVERQKKRVRECAILEQRMTEAFPNSRFSLINLFHKVIVRGKAKDAEERDQILSLAREEVERIDCSLKNDESEQTSGKSKESSAQKRSSLVIDELVVADEDTPK